MPSVSAQYAIIMRVEIDHRPGMLGRVATAIGEAGGSIGAVDLIGIEGGHTLRDITIETAGEEHARAIADAVDRVDGARAVDITDRTFQMHVGGKIETRIKHPVRTRDDLSRAYTPGVARVCTAIHEDRSKAFQYTIKRNTVAVVSDGSAVLGLGDIGPEAAMPVMEGKAVLFKEFAGVDAFPLCVATTDVDEIVAFCKAIAPTFGGINLEDISAPRCFEIEERLRRELDIPVFHDDQHGTAIVVLAALVNALQVVGKRLEDIRVVITGVGAAGVAVTRVLQSCGVEQIVGCDRQGAIHSGRSALSEPKRRYAEETNPDGLSGAADDVLAGADVFIGLSQPGAVTRRGIESMAADAIVFAMANPTPEISPEHIADLAAVVATGRSDYPNQINNVLAFPGVFRGALDIRASTITPGMEIA